MKIQIFIEGEEGQVLIDRSYQVVDGNAPAIDLQDLVDDAVRYDNEAKEVNMFLQARQLTQHND